VSARTRNPLEPLRGPVPLPAARSRTALGLAAMAAEGRFALQTCAECGAVQYPPRDVCGACLGGDLPWRDVPPGGTLKALTTTRVSGERYFRERTPWRSGPVASDAGPVVVAHLHRGLKAGDRVRLDLRLDHAGRGAVLAYPEDPMAATDDPAFAEFSADPRGRRVLVTDGRAATGPALVRALVEAGADKVFLGVADAWKPFGRGGLPETAEVVPLDPTDSASVGELAGRIGDKVDILVNNAGHVRPGGVGAGPVLAREIFETNCLGLMRLAAAFGPVMRARTAQAGRSSAAFVNLASAWALAPEADFAVYGASQAAARALTAALRAESRPSGLRVVDVLTGPVEDPWHQALRPPKVAPAALAKAVVAALREGREEVVVGDVAREIFAKWVEDPRLLRQEAR
jgi:NAD(P)-dependent dehydrogenase (short-subunit alcohol dehydrogenase family)/uncharacterized OB-fold protein